MYIVLSLQQFGDLVLWTEWQNSTGKCELINPNDSAEGTLRTKLQIMRKKQAIALLNLPESQGEARVEFSVAQGNFQQAQNGKGH